MPAVAMSTPPPAAPPAPSTTPSPCGKRDESAFSSYNEKRMHRNRQSAAKSRRQKREYVENLERNVLVLENAVEQLRQQNWYLHSLRTVDLGDALHIDWNTLDAIDSEHAQL